MTNLEATDHTISQGSALVRAIEALETIEPSDDTERAIARLLVEAYRRRLRAIIGNVRGWMGDRVLGASRSIPDSHGTLTGRT